MFNIGNKSGISTHPFSILTLRIMIDRIYFGNTMFIMDVLDVNWRAVADFFEKNRSLKTPAVDNFSFSLFQN